MQFDGNDPDPVNKFSVTAESENSNAGFAMKFENGYAVSIIWHSSKRGGPAAYGDGKNLAEIAVIGHGDRTISAHGWQTPEQIAAIIADTARLRPLTDCNV